jgi:outer membrane receptor for ferrienterochelin and colicin
MFGFLDHFRLIVSLIFLLIIVTNFILVAQSDTDYRTDEIVVSASRYEENIEFTNQAISIIPNSVLETVNPFNMANALTGEVGLWMQQTNHGGGSPFLRGLTGNQTLIMIDGIRLNNSTFRYGPNQYLNTISINDVQRIEVLRGSGSVQYGSDALGGVLHILTKTPEIGLSKQISTGFQLKYMSDAMEQSANAFLDYSSSNSGYHASFSYKNYGDLVAGGKLGKENPSSYNEYSINIKNRHRVSDKVLLTYNYQYLQQNDIDRFDQVNQRGYDYYKFDPQKRQLAYIKSEFYLGSDLAQKISITGSWQQSSESRRTKKAANSFKTIEYDVIDTWGVNILHLTKLLNNWNINSGIEYYFDFVESRTSTFTINDNLETKKRGLYADGSKSHNFSIFTLSNLKIDKYEISFGGRYNLASLEIKDEIFGQPKINPDALTGHLTFSYNPNKYFKIISKLNTAYRIPNINDVSSFGLFDYGIEVPNNNLLPERSFNYEVGLKFNSFRIRSSLFIFRSNLTDLIDRVRSTYNGTGTYNGEQVYTKINSGNAFIQGIEFDFKYSPSNNIVINNILNYTYGKNKSNDEPMRRIPPLNGALSLIYDFIESTSVRFEYLYALKQDRLSSGDIDDHRISEGGTQGWNVFNIYANYYIGKFNIGIGFNNILDEAYRMHGSGIDGIGRSFQLIGRYVY